MISITVFKKKLSIGTIMPSIAATINQALNLYSHFIGDVGAEIALPGKPKTGWKKYSEIFCDNVIF
jgi:hypothetical protein